MIEVKNKWAFITGASRGIGYCLAIFMARQGCNLILHSRKIEHLEKVKEEALKYCVEVFLVEAELSEEVSVRTMLDQIDKKPFEVDILFNNAGVQIAYRENYLATPVEDYEMSFKVNTIAPAMICYHFLPKMVNKGFGRIINTTSGIQLEPQQAGYSASKAALDKITIDIGSKLEGTDVCINLSDPGWCRTDLGGARAPNSPESSLPGIAIGAFIDDQKSGRHFSAQAYSGKKLYEAVRLAEAIPSIY